MPNIPNQGLGQQLGQIGHDILDWLFGGEKPKPPNINAPMYQYGGGKEIDAWIQNSLDALKQEAGQGFNNQFNQYMGSVGQRGLYNTDAPALGGQRIADTIQKNLALAMADVLGKGQGLKIGAWDTGMNRYNTAYQNYLQQLNSNNGYWDDIINLGVSLL